MQALTTAPYLSSPQVCTYEHVDPAQRDFLTCSLCETERNLAIAPITAPPRSPQRSPMARPAAAIPNMGVASRGRPISRNLAEPPRRSPFEQRYWSLAPPAAAAGAAAGGAVSGGAVSGGAVSGGARGGSRKGPSPHAPAADWPVRDHAHGAVVGNDPHEGGAAVGAPSRAHPPAVDARSSAVAGAAPQLLEPWDEMRVHIGAWLERHGCGPHLSVGDARGTPIPKAAKAAKAAVAAVAQAAQATQAAQAAVDSEDAEDEVAAVEVMETAARPAPINPPDPTELLAYARALVQACRLDEVACLGRLVERRCAWRPECKPMLHAFVRGVDEAVKGQFGGRLASLAGMRRILLDQRVDVDA